MKFLYTVFLIMIIIFCTGHTHWDDYDLPVSYQPNTDKLETIFKTALPLKDGIIFTKVPRGLIVSIDERYFFSDGEARIKESSLCILDRIILLLHELSNYCVVENHTEDNNLSGTVYNDDCEISLARSTNIVQYMIKYGKIPPDRLFALGYGQYMPFRANVKSYDSSKGTSTGMAASENFRKSSSRMNKRIDFVILEYEARR